MPHFSSDGVDIAYRDLGAGDPILLIHGFASNSMVNWVLTGWADALVQDGRRVIAMDVRGHGDSARLTDPAAYRLDLMAADAANLLQHLGVARADVMGYSMGARVATLLALDHPEKVRSLVIGGMGASLTKSAANAEEIARALEAPAGALIRNEDALGYRTFAERTRSDLRALAACMRGQRPGISAEHLGLLRAPVLVAVGTEDHIAGSARALAALIPRADVLDVVGRDHMRATGDKQYKAGVLDFLKRRP